MKFFFDENQKIKKLPKNYGKKMEILNFLATQFDKEKIYSENEINLILNELHLFNDHCILRRELYNNFYLDRSPDGKKYWRIK